jgi:AhpD family alkylhydroperoxidase
MPTQRPPQDPENHPRVKAVFDWRTLAFDPDLLERTWQEVRQVMAMPSLLDPITKEMVFIAVSVANACTFCVHSHTAAARAKGMTDAQYAELLSIIAVAGKTNQLATALQVPVDAVLNAV